MEHVLRRTVVANAASVLVTAQEVVLPRIYERFSVTHYQEPVKTMPRDLLLKEIPNHQGLYCLLRDEINKEVLSEAKKLKIISTMSVGHDHIDIEECKKRNIIVTITPKVLTETTAETTIALLLATARRIPEAIEDAKNGGWGIWTPFYMCGVGLRNSIVGIVGFGRIGKSVARKIKTFNPSRILFNDTKLNIDSTLHEDVEFATLDYLLAHSDFVIITCSVTKDNVGFVDKEFLSKMKKNAILVNTSRGSLVNQKDLYDALVSDQILAAGLDVTTPEPLPTDSPLFQLKNCVIFPHIGSSTVQTRNDMMKLAEDGIVYVLSGGKAPDKIRVA